MHYVIGDVHGCYSLMLKLISKIEEQDKDAFFIFVGDFMDRGPQVIETLNWAMKHITPDGKYQSVIGNHEFMILEWFEKYKEWFSTDGNVKTEPKTRYDFYDRAMEADILSIESMTPIMDFFKSLSFRKELTVPVKDKDGNITEKTYVIVHAWDDENVSDRDRCNMNLWHRNYSGNNKTDKIIVHGHTPTFDLAYRAVNKNARPGMIMYSKNSINVDGGATFAGLYPCYPTMLCGLCLETLEEFYAETVEESIRRGNVGVAEDVIMGYVKNYERNYLG